MGGTSEEKLAESDEIVAIQIYSLSKKEWLQSEPKNWKCKLWNLCVFKAWKKIFSKNKQFEITEDSIVAISLFPSYNLTPAKALSK